MIKKFNEYTKESTDFTSWYRGYTTNTKDSEYIWITSNKKHAKQYADINKYSYGGDPIVKKYFFSEDDFELLDLYSYDMDDKVNEFEIDEFLSDIGYYYDYEDIFDIMEDKVPLSRLVNKTLSHIVSNHVNGFKIFEDGIKTIYIRKDLLNNFDN